MREPAATTKTIVTITDECLQKLRRDGGEQVTDEIFVRYEKTHATQPGDVGEGCYVQSVEAQSAA